MNDIKKNGNGNGINCGYPGVNRLKDGSIEEIFQPLQQSKYIKLTYGGVNDGVVAIGDQQAVLQFLAGLGGIPTMLPSSDLDQNLLRLFNNSGDLEKLICKIRIQVSQSWVGLFGVNPVYFSANTDNVQKPQPINLSDYVNEYSYRDLVLSVPVKFMIDNFSAFLWDLTQLPGEQVDGSLTITMYIQKEFGRIYSIT